MAFTWTGDMTSVLQQVRSLLGDVVDTRPRFTDEAINSMLTAQGNAVGATALALIDRLIGQYALDVDHSELSMSVSASQRMSNLMTWRASVVSALAAGAVPGAGGGGGPQFAGITVAERDALAERTDLIKPAFYVGMHSNPDAGDDDDPLTS